MVRISTLFSGIGSPEQALKELEVNHQVVFACDNNKWARKTYQANHTAHIFFDDIMDITSNDLNDKLDFLIFGPPCQSFSIAGFNNGFSDVRGKLFLRAIDILNTIRPKYFIAENVVGILHHNFSYLSSLMEKYYYLDVKIFNTLDFGIPQHRRRVYIIGQRRDLPYKTIQIKSQPYKKLKHFLDNTVDDRFFATNSFLNKGKVKRKLDSYDKDYINCITQTISRNGSSGEYISYVCAVNHAIRQLRKPTPRECARLQGFSDDFVIPDISVTQQYIQFANTMSVPILKEIFLELIYNGSNEKST